MTLQLQLTRAQMNYSNRIIPVYVHIYCDHFIRPAFRNNKYNVNGSSGTGKGNRNAHGNRDEPAGGNAVVGVSDPPVTRRL